MKLKRCFFAVSFLLATADYTLVSCMNQESEYITDDDFVTIDKKTLEETTRSLSPFEDLASGQAVSSSNPVYIVTAQDLADALFDYIAEHNTKQQSDFEHLHDYLGTHHDEIINKNVCLLRKTDTLLTPLGEFFSQHLFVEHITIIKNLILLYLKTPTARTTTFPTPKNIAAAIAADNSQACNEMGVIINAIYSIFTQHTEVYEYDTANWKQILETAFILCVDQEDLQSYQSTEELSIQALAEAIGKSLATIRHNTAIIIDPADNSSQNNTQPAASCSTTTNTNQLASITSISSPTITASISTQHDVTQTIVCVEPPTPSTSNNNAILNLADAEESNFDSEMCCTGLCERISQGVKSCTQSCSYYLSNLVSKKKISLIP